MKKRKRILSGLLLMICLVAWTAAQDDLTARLEQSKQALDNNNNQLAYDILSQLLREHPENETVNFYMGRAAYRVGRLSHSAMAYERVLILNPDNHVARAQLAKTYMDMEQYALARENFEAVLQHEPPPHVKEDIERLLAKIKTADTPWNFWGRVDVAGFYDDNVNFGPGSDIVDTSLGQLQLAPDSLAKEAFGLSLTLNANGLYDVGEKGGWFIAGDAGAYGTILDNAHDRELFLMRSGAGLQHVGRRSFLQLPFNYQHLDKGGDSYVNISGFKPALLYGLSPNWHLVSSGTAEYRDYTSLHERDGGFLSLDETLRRYFGNRRHSVSFTLSGFHEDAKISEYINTGWESALACELRLPARMASYCRVRYKDSYYRGKSELETEDRHDRNWQFLVGLNKVLINNWGLDVSYLYSDNISTYDLYDYDRSIVTLSSFFIF